MPTYKGRFYTDLQISIFQDDRVYPCGCSLDEGCICHEDGDLSVTEDDDWDEEWREEADEFFQ